MVTVSRGWISRPNSLTDQRDLKAVERRHVGSAVDQVLEVLGAAGSPAVPIVREGDAKQEILSVATEHQSDLIVLGARGLGGFRGLVLGSVSRAVSAAAPCSTLVVAGQPGDPGLRDR